MKWIGQNIYDQISKFRNTVDFSEDVTFYQPVNDANPTISLGKDANDRFEIQTVYNSGAQTIDQVIFNTYTTSTTNHDGRYVFKVDEVELGKFIDTGLFVTGNIQGSGASSMISARDSAASSATQGGLLRLISDDGAVMGDNHRLGVIQFKGAEDGSNTTSVGARIQAICRDAWDGSNNDADLEFYTTDGTTESKVLTLDADQLATFTGNVALNTVTSGAWQGDVIASAYLDADTAHLAGAQTFTGAKAFANGIIFEGNRTLTPGDGAFIHQDTAVITDGDTSASGTAAMFGAVNIEGARLAATNSSVTTTAAASLYVKGAPSASTNQTITNAYALWVDDGLVKFDGALTVGGTITGDVTGDLTGEADTVATIAGLAPNTATTQATQGNITTLAGVTSIGATTMAITSGVVNHFRATNDGNPVYSMGSSGTNELKIQTVYHSGAQTLEQVIFRSETASGTADDGKMIFQVDGLATLQIDDGGIDFVANHGISIDGTDILTDSSGTATLSNIDALDATTITTIETALEATQKQLTHHNFTQDVDTDKYYIGFTEGDAEAQTTTSSSLPIVAPFAGKLLKVFLRSNKNLHGLTLTWRLETQAGVTFGTGPSVVGTQSGVGCQNTTMTTYDFTSSLDSGDNLIDAGDAVYLSVQSGGATASTKFYITCLWEWDLS